MNGIGLVRTSQLHALAKTQTVSFSLVAHISMSFRLTHIPTHQSVPY